MDPTLGSRRTFLSRAGQAAIGVAAVPYLARGASARTYRAVVIGHTGAGDYGHGFDTIFEDFENVSVVGLADLNPAGLERAAARAKARKAYRDYREMLQKEKPDLVSIASRHPTHHKEVALAAIESGAHLLLEKPMTEHLEDADAIVEAAGQRGSKIVVGHQYRYTADFQRIKQLIDEGFFGTILEMRVQGKQDRRAGGEDLIVLGTHDFDTMRLFFGDPEWCFASVTQDGRPIRKEDLKRGREPILVAGDTVRAHFHFGRVLCSWQSITAENEWHVAPRGTERWGFHLFGTRRILAYYSVAGARYWDSPFLGHPTQTSEWKELPEPKQWPPPAHRRSLVQDLIHAIEQDARPYCNAVDGRWTIEMVAGVYESARTQRPVQFPLKDRANPITRL